MIKKQLKKDIKDKKSLDKSIVGLDHSAAPFVIERAAGLAATRLMYSYNMFYDTARKEFEDTGKIKGFEVYCVNSNVKVWVSHYDLESLNNG
jgi:hypothetical protein